MVDSVLRVETAVGSCWRRYNHDGYGQRADGGPFLGSGVGRAWPLLTGERAHYELAAGRDPESQLRALESFACRAGLLPEQVWDEADRPEQGLHSGRSTGAMMPLMWAHAEAGVHLVESLEDPLRIVVGVSESAQLDVGPRHQVSQRAPARTILWRTSE